MFSALHNDIHAPQQKFAWKIFNERLKLQLLHILKYQSNSTGNLVAAAQKCHIENKIFI